MSSDSLGTFVHRLSGVYRDPQRVLRDAEKLLSSPLGTHLRPTTEPLTLNDGSSTPPVLLLRGTLPMTYRNVTYNLPIDMYLPPPYPLRPPTVFVRPVTGMAIKENHRHVGLDGRVYLPYLHDWRPGTHELRELAVWMSSLFGSEPPCYAKPAGSSTGGGGGSGRSNDPPPPPYAAASTSSSANASYSSGASSALYGSSGASTAHASNVVRPSDRSKKQQEEERRRIEREIADANAAARIAREAEEKEARAIAERKRLAREEKQTLESARAMASSKVQYEIQELFRSQREELRTEMRAQKRLEYGRDRIGKVLEEGKERKGALERDNERMDEAVDGLEKWLAAVKEQQRERSSSAPDEKEGRATKADRMATPADTHSAQMLALSAENAAIDDCVYFLDQSLVKGNISVEVFLKEVRKLSKRQFMAKAHLIKIAQSRAAERG